MKILHLSMYEGTGAGRAASRLHFGLLQAGVDSVLLTMSKTSKHPSVINLPKGLACLKEIQGKLIGNKFSKLLSHGSTFSINVTPSSILKYIEKINADIVNLHWIGWEFMRIEDLERLQNPLVWTLQDMWSFTGGCHYSGACDRYLNSCGSCPQLRSGNESDLSRWIWQRKVNAWENLNLTIVAPSQWIGKCANQSSLFHNRRVEVVPFSLDTEKCTPQNKLLARKALGLPINIKIVLFGALSATEDERKGFQYLLPALRQLSQSEWRDNLELVIFGASKPSEPIDLGFKAHYLGQVGDDELIQAYSAADVMVVPSIQESFGQTASESLACGTPVVAFNNTGLKDIIDHQKNGYLAAPFEVRDLAQGIDWILRDDERHQELRRNAREKAVSSFCLSKQANKYISIYNEILMRN